MLQLFPHHVGNQVAHCVNDSLSQGAQVQLRQGLAVCPKGHGAEFGSVDLPADDQRLLGGWFGITLRPLFTPLPPLVLALSRQALGAALCLVAGKLPGVESLLEQRLARLRQVFSQLPAVLLGPRPRSA